jgi:hypothetical protein
MKIDLNTLPDCSEIERIKLQNDFRAWKAEMSFELTMDYILHIENEKRS